MVQAEPRTRILVISLKAAATDLEWEFLDAHESLHSDLSYNEEDAVVAKGRPLTRGEIGCYSSHFEAWRQLVESDHDQ